MLTVANTKVFVALYLLIVEIGHKSFNSESL